MQSVGQWGNFDNAFCDELAEWIGDRRVLETFAGNGLLAAMLSERGVDIVSTSLFAGHDGHETKIYHDVIEMDAITAVESYGDSRDVLLMCWPTVTEATTYSAILWGGDRPIVFIGEVTDLKNQQYGGCATDLFFELTSEVSDLPAYSPRNYIDRAGIRKLEPELVNKWRARSEDNADTGIAPLSY